MFTFTQPLKDIRNNNSDDEEKKTLNSTVVRTNGCRGINQESSENNTSLELINRGNKTKPFDPMTPIRETSREYKTTQFYTSEEYNIPNLSSAISTPRSGIKFDLASPIKSTEGNYDSDALAPPVFPRLSNPCNPIDPKVIEQFLAAVRPPVSHYKGFYDARKQTFDNGSKIEKISRCWETQGRRSTNVSVNVEEPIIFFNDSFFIRQKVAEGGYGNVYLVIDRKDFAVNQNEKKSSRALKKEMPSNVWEFYIVRQLQERINSPAIDSIISVHSLY
jgi:checkpoint serine/threonine-protein kinase